MAPVISVVLYWGDGEWDGPRCLHDLLQFPEGKEEDIRALVPDYPINIINMSQLSQTIREQLHTDLRLLADYLAVKKEPQKRKQLLKDTDGELLYLEDTLAALSAIADDSHYQKMVKVLKEKKEKKEAGGIVMCEVWKELWNDGWNDGNQSGIQTGILALVRLGRDCNLPDESIILRIMQEFQITKQEADQYMHSCA